MEHFLETWGYLAVFLLSFISSMGLLVGAEVAVIYGGVLASGQVPGELHPVDFAVVIVVAALGEILGCLAGYAIGHRGGRPLVDKVGRYVLLTHRDLDRAEAWMDGRGDSFVLLARFIPLVRSFVSFAAGLGEMALGKFLLLTAIGSVIWCVGLTGLGYSLGSNYNRVLKDFSDAGYLMGGLAVAVMVVLFTHRLKAVRAQGRIIPDQEAAIGVPLRPTIAASDPVRTDDYNLYRDSRGYVWLEHRIAGWHWFNGEMFVHSSAPPVQALPFELRLDPTQ